MIVTFADGGEEFVSIEGEAADGIDFVDEDDQRAGVAFEFNIAEGSEEALDWAEAFVAQPEVVEIIFLSESASYAAEETIVPLFGRHVLSDGGQVEDGDGCALVAEFEGSAHHEGGLAHLPGSQDVREFTLHETGEQFVVGLAFDVGWGVGAEGSFIVEIALAGAVEVAQTFFRESGFNAGEEENGVARFGQEIVRPHLDAMNGGGCFIGSGKHDDGDLGEVRIGFELGDDLEAVHAGHDHIEQDEVDGLCAGQLKGSGTVVGLERSASLAAQAAFEHFLMERVIIDDEDGGAGPGGRGGGVLERDGGCNGDGPDGC